MSLGKDTEPYIDECGIIHRSVNTEPLRGDSDAGCKALVLQIKKKWFDMILSGEKKEEYREIKPYYQSRFSHIFSMVPYSNGIPDGPDAHRIRFRNGYGRSCPEFEALCTLDIKTGRQEWGAEPGKEYYVLRIKQILGKKNCD